jgi:hypothetical protein
MSRAAVEIKPHDLDAARSVRDIRTSRIARRRDHVAPFPREAFDERLADSCARAGDDNPF